MTPIEQERDRLRDLIEEIADMGIGEPEAEHRDIIARCRAEMKRWERTLCTVGALCLIAPGLKISLLGIALMVPVVLHQWQMRQSSEPS